MMSFAALIPSYELALSSVLPKHMSGWINLAGNIWALVFVASFALSIIVGAIQQHRGKELWDTPLLPLLALLHFGWVVPLTIFIAAKTAIIWVPILALVLLTLVVLIATVWLTGRIQKWRKR